MRASDVKMTTKPDLSIGDGYISKTGFTIVVVDYRHNGKEWLYLVQNLLRQSNCTWLTYSQYKELSINPIRNIYTVYHQTFDNQLINKDVNS